MEAPVDRPRIAAGFGNQEGDAYVAEFHWITGCIAAQRFSFCSLCFRGGWRAIVQLRVGRMTLPVSTNITNSS
ncbi:hypothetical protein BZL30_4440 [Mycobacterium kansasii]|uniref:Uncharacterized protein n=1 Tax=Mycobacterium kansasii TaxID=1768 RepID=A0A1V3X665_MYCKA|nr:hypothetical protein BZL29_8086 [Mycobacterium kansasii]OOK73951.1 hypothetical protein BZL30_4440 [Mycobacterium kansasii]